MNTACIANKNLPEYSKEVPVVFRRLQNAIINSV